MDLNESASGCRLLLCLVASLLLQLVSAQDSAARQEAMITAHTVDKGEMTHQSLIDRHVLHAPNPGESQEQKENILSWAGRQLSRFSENYSRNGGSEPSSASARMEISQ